MISGGTKPPRPPAAPTMPVTEPTLSAVPAGRPGRRSRRCRHRGRRPWPGTRSCPAAREPGVNACTAAPTTTTASAAARTRVGARRSDSQPPNGRITTASSHEAGHPVGGVGLGEPVGGLEVGGQVDRERDVPAEQDRVQGGRLPGDPQTCVGGQPPRSVPAGTRPAGCVAQQQRGQQRVSGQGDRGDHERGRGPHGGEELDGGQRADRGAAHAGAEHPDRQSPPLGREPGVDERHTDGEGGAADAEEEPADQQPGQRGVPDGPR